jgi:HTH-type transcriptional regulator/antitoxin HigA
MVLAKVVSMNRVLAQAVKHWSYVAPLVSYPANEHAFDELVAQLDELLQIVGVDEEHPLMKLVDILSYLISTYEAARDQKRTGKGIDALKYLMGAHQLHQSDFPEIASQGVMSDLLNGKRSLNLRQIKLLSKRFNVDPATFIDD